LLSAEYPIVDWTTLCGDVALVLVSATAVGLEAELESDPTSGMTSHMLFSTTEPTIASINECRQSSAGSNSGPDSATGDDDDAAPP